MATLVRLVATRNEVFAPATFPSGIRSWTILGASQPAASGEPRVKGKSNKIFKLLVLQGFKSKQTKCKNIYYNTCLSTLNLRRIYAIFNKYAHYAHRLLNLALHSKILLHDIWYHQHTCTCKRTIGIFPLLHWSNSLRGSCALPESSTPPLKGDDGPLKLAMAV